MKKKSDSGTALGIALLIFAAILIVGGIAFGIYVFIEYGGKPITEIPYCALLILHPKR